MNLSLALVVRPVSEIWDCLNQQLALLETHFGMAKEIYMKSQRLTLFILQNRKPSWRAISEPLRQPPLHS